MSSSDKTLTLILVFLMGTFTLINFSVFFSLIVEWIMVYGVGFTDFMSFFINAPVVLVFLLVPAVVRKLGLSISICSAYVVNIVSGLAMIFSYKLAAKSLIASKLVTVFIMFVFQIALSLSQNGVFKITNTMDYQVTQFYIAGLASSNLFVGLIKFVLDKTIKSNSKKFILMMCFNICVHIPAFVVYYFFRKMYMKNLDKKDSKKNEDKPDPENQGEESYMHVFWRIFKMKLFYYVLIAATFTTLFVVFPNIMINMMSNAAVGLIIFGVAELSGRLLDAMGFKIVKKIFNLNHVFSFAIIQFIFCFIALGFYFNFSKRIGKPINAQTRNIICYVLYTIIAFLLGINGNVIVGSVFVDVSPGRDTSVAATMAAASLNGFILVGSIISYAIRTLLQR